MAREALRERFLAILSSRGGRAGNKGLRNDLGWQEATYEQVKEELLGQGLIVSGRGQGGSVAVADAADVPVPAASSAKPYLSHVVKKRRHQP